MSSDLAKLQATASTVLQASDNRKAAAAKLARTLMEDAMRPLLVALCMDYLTRLPDPVDAPKAAPQSQPASRRRQGRHQRTKTIGTPTPQARAGAIAARTLVADEIFRRRIRGEGPLGNIQINRLRAIAESQATTATSFLQRGYDDGVEAIACQILSDYCVAADPFAVVADAIPARVAKRAFADAKIKAAQVIADASTRTANDLIASARPPVQIEGDARV
jgi:hypothetical protein